MGLGYIDGDPNRAARVRDVSDRVAKLTAVIIAIEAYKYIDDNESEPLPADVLEYLMRHVCMSKAVMSEVKASLRAQLKSAHEMLCEELSDIGLVETTHVKAGRG